MDSVYLYDRAVVHLCITKTVISENFLRYLKLKLY